MQVSFLDLVGTTVAVPPCHDIDELTDLAPDLQTVKVVHDIQAQASEANGTSLSCAPCSWIPADCAGLSAAEGSENLLENCASEADFSMSPHTMHCCLVP